MNAIEDFGEQIQRSVNEFVDGIITSIFDPLFKIAFYPLYVILRVEEIVTDQPYEGTLPGYYE